MRIDEGSEVEIGQIVGVARQEERLALHPVAVRDECPRAAEQLGLIHRAYGGRAVPGLEVTLDLIGEMVGVDQHLGDAGEVEGVEPPVEQGGAPDRQQAFGLLVGERTQPRTEAGGEKEGLHWYDIRTTPSWRIRALASLRTQSRPCLFSSQAA